MRQKSSHDDGSIQIAAGFVQSADVASPSLTQSAQQLKEEGHEENKGHQDTGGGRARIKGPTADQEQESARRQQAPAKIVKDLPPIDPSQPIRNASLPRSIRDSAQNP